MQESKLQILDPAGVEARLKRMAFEIYEAHYHESKLIVIGIDERGGFIANALVRWLKEISPLEISYISAKLDRSGGSGAIGIDLGEEKLEDFESRPVLVVDDVLYSGTTLINVVSILLQARPSAIRTAVLIDRGHRHMPVSADFVGLELATTIHQHVSVEVNIDEKRAEAFLR